MTKPQEVIALIPARGDSKRVPRKNIKLLAGRPLIAYSIEQALNTPEIHRVVVSTDDAEIAQIAQEWGAEVPFLRPKEFALDHSTDLEVFQHFLGWLVGTENNLPEILVHLRPTHPVRRVEDIQRVIEILANDPLLDAVRSIVIAPETPYKMWFRNPSGLLSAVIDTEMREAHSQPRQALPETYLQNACIDALRPRTILEKRSMTGDRVFGYIMNSNFDIDTEAQFEQASKEISLLGLSINMPRKTFCFDVDGVIATLVEGNHYSLAQPRKEMINAINQLYEIGHKIILFTARGSATGIDWTKITQEQMTTWGVKYHELRFGKPAADYYIDDRMLDVADVLHLAAQPVEKVDKE